MALDEEQSLAAAGAHDAADCLRGCEALAGVDAEALRILGAGAVHFSLPAGAPLFDAGTAADGAYLVVNGSLGVRTPGDPAVRAKIEAAELVGELGWLLGESRGAQVIALRDSELLMFECRVLDEAAACSPSFSLAIARLCARRLAQGGRRQAAARARSFAIVPNGTDADAGSFATQLVTELTALGRAQLVWDVRASAQTSEWFNHIEASNDFVVYLADPQASGWTRQCCRQADVLLLVADAGGAPRPWPEVVAETVTRSRTPVELVLLHAGALRPGCAARWRAAAPPAFHHHVVDALDVGRVARLLTGRGVGLVLSGGGARGFAHLGVIRALREARVPIDHVGGASIGSIIAAGVAMGWSDEEMHDRYRRCFVDTNPVNDYTFPYLALTRGRKVSRLLRGEFGDTAIEDLRVPFFCASANLATGRTAPHRQGPLWRALRASVAIPGVMPPVFGDGEILVDGAAINNLPVDLMREHDPGFVIGSDAGLERALAAGNPAINIFQILMRAGMIGGAAGGAAQRALADVILKPALDDVDLLNWQAFERVVAAGYDRTRTALGSLPQLPRAAAARGARPAGASFLNEEIARRLGGRTAAGRH